MSALKGARYWRVGDRLFPAANISEEGIREVLVGTGFRPGSINVRSVPAEILDENGEGAQGYQGIICVTATKQDREELRGDCAKRWIPGQIPISPINVS